MNIRGRIYRLIMKIAHRFDWHYAPIIGPFEDGSTQRWCKWCGFRESYKKPTKDALSVPIQERKCGGCKLFEALGVHSFACLIRNEPIEITKTNDPL